MAGHVRLHHDESTRTRSSLGAYLVSSAEGTGVKRLIALHVCEREHHACACGLGHSPDTHPDPFRIDSALRKSSQGSQSGQEGLMLVGRSPPDFFICLDTRQAARKVSWLLPTGCLDTPPQNVGGPLSVIES